MIRAMKPAGKVTRISLYICFVYIYIVYLHRQKEQKMMRISFLIALVVLCMVLSFQHGLIAAQESAELLPSILLDSVVNRDIDGIGRALEHGENVDLTNDKGWSAARFAVAVGDLDVLRELIDRGIDLNNADAEGVTPLMAAAASVS